MQKYPLRACRGVSKRLARVIVGTLEIANWASCSSSNGAHADTPGLVDSTMNTGLGGSATTGVGGATTGDGGVATDRGGTTDSAGDVPAVAAPPPVFVAASYYPDIKASLTPGDHVGASAIRVLTNGQFVFVQQRFDDAIAELGAFDSIDRGVVKSLTFSALADVAAHLDDVPKEITWIGFDMEPGMTPADEIDPSNYVSTVEQFAQIVQKSRRKVSWGPISSAFDGLEKAGQLGAVLAAVDAAVYQGQQLFENQGAKAFEDEMQRQRAIVKGHNQNVDFNAQLWVTLQKPDQVIEGFNLAHADLDLAVIGTPASVPSTDIQHILDGLAWRK